MADQIITITVKDINNSINKLSDMVDFTYPGRLNQEPIPGKMAWVQKEEARLLKAKWKQCYKLYKKDEFGQTLDSNIEVEG